MASGNGYIRKWIVDDVGGIIHICGGQSVGDDIAFPFSQCSPQLKAILVTESINKEVDCPAPNGAVRVTFDFDFFGSLPIAKRVDLN